MKLSLLCESVRIVRWSEDDDYYNIYAMMDEADAVAERSHIRVSRDKELSFVALDDNDKIVGAVWRSITEDNHHFVYSCDIAVDPAYRNSDIGIKLIKYSIGDYKIEQQDLGNMYMSVLVVNRKLARVLERKFGFEIEGEYGSGPVHMTYYS